MGINFPNKLLLTLALSSSSINTFSCVKMKKKMNIRSVSHSMWLKVFAFSFVFHLIFTWGVHQKLILYSFCRGFFFFSHKSIPKMHKRLCVCVWVYNLQFVCKLNKTRFRFIRMFCCVLYFTAFDRSCNGLFFALSECCVLCF